MSKKQLSKKEWGNTLNQVRVSKDDLNRLVMNYLVIEGYKDAAQCFATETNLTPAVDLESIENRMVIRSAIQRGDIEEAIGRVNELDPEILDTHPLLFFRLQQQRLIELIRYGDVSAALTFAAEELAPRGEEFPHLLPELERTMALLAFDIPTDGSAPQSGALAPPAHVVDLLSPAQRLRTAGELNAAILESQSQARDPKLPNLVRLLEAGEALLGGDVTANSASSSARAHVMQFPRLDLWGALQDLQSERDAETSATSIEV